MFLRTANGSRPAGPTHLRRVFGIVVVFGCVVVLGCGTKPLDESDDPDTGAGQADTATDDSGTNPGDTGAAAAKDAGSTPGDTASAAKDASTAAADTATASSQDTASRSICDACVDPFPGCALVQGKWACVQCSIDAHCAGSTCDLSTNTCATVDAGATDAGSQSADAGSTADVGAADTTIYDAAGGPSDVIGDSVADAVVDAGPKVDPVCATCKSPFAACAKLKNGIWACVECANDADCAKLKKGTCSLTTYSCNPASTSGGSSGSGSSSSGSSSGSASGSSSGSTPMCIGCPCKTDLDCKGKCGPKAQACDCNKGPSGDVCMAACFFDSDCPINTSGQQLCSVQGYCIGVPASSSSSGGSGSSGGAAKCKTAADCTGKCGPVKICTCAQLPSGYECAPGCKVSNDCPKFSNGKQGICTVQGYCIPSDGSSSSSGGGSGGSGSGGGSGGGKPGPKCQSDADCKGKGKCIDGTKFCGCRTVPGEGQQCVGTCKTHADCPSTPDGKKTGVCGSGGICGYK